MTASAQLRSGKASHDENFPVASRLIKRRHRPVILAFYEFVRVADDIADHPRLGREEKLMRLDRLESSLLGSGSDEPEGVSLRTKLEKCGLSARHALDLLSAFRQDVTKHRYVSWDELIDYCSRSAMPVGRFVLDAHGEGRGAWPASDALCAALQIINHLQDCASDYQALDRVYVPLDILAAKGIGVEAIGEGRAGPELRQCLDEMVARTTALLEQSHGLEAAVSDWRLGLEISVIQSLAARLLALLRVRDPLSETAHLTKLEMLAVATRGSGRGLLRRLSRTVTPTQSVPDAMSIQIPYMTNDHSRAASHAGSSSFYLAMRLLRRERREAMFEVYSFCREVDDIADSDAPRWHRLARLAVWRQDIDALYSGHIPLGLDRLAKAIGRFDLRKDDFIAVIEGMEMDARWDIRAPHLKELEFYCDRVACAVGRLSVRIFGMHDADGDRLAHHLGRALQYTNILRDIDDDAGIGRLYLPQEALHRAEIDTTDPEVAIKSPRLGVACAFLAERAREHFTKADEIMSECSRQVVRAPKIMGEVYRQMLDDMTSRGWAWPRHRVHVNRSQLLWIALRHAFV